MENSPAVDEPLNASQILHLAIQKVDGIIASNDSIDASSSSSGTHLHHSHHRSNTENSFYESTSTFHFTSSSSVTPQTITSVFQNRSNNHKNINNSQNKESISPLNSLSKSFSPIHENNFNSNNNSVNGNRKIARNQDKLNKLLQELQDFSMEEQSGSLFTGSTNGSISKNDDQTTQLAAQTTPSGSATPGSGQQQQLHSSMLSQNITTPSSDVSNCGMKSLQVSATQQTSFQPNTVTSATGAPIACNTATTTTDHHFQTVSPVNDNISLQSQTHPQSHLPSQASLSGLHLENGLELSEKVIHLESMNNILRSQLLNTEELFKKSLLSKKTLENANCDLLTVIDKLKLDISHAENLRKLAEKHTLRTETENQTLKTRLLERETEISSLRLTLAKIVRTTGYTLSDNELALLSGKTIASDYIKNKLLTPSSTPQHQATPRKDITPITTPIKPVTLPRNVPSGAFYSEPASRRDSFTSTLCGGSRHNSVQPSPSGTPPPPQRHTSTVQQSKHSSQAFVPGQMVRSTSAENMKLNGNISTGDNENATENTGDFNSATNTRNASIYSTLPHSVRKVRRTRGTIEPLRGASVDIDRRQNNGNNFSGSDTLYRHDNFRSLFDDLNLVPLSPPTTPIMKSSVHYIGKWPTDHENDSDDEQHNNYKSDGETLNEPKHSRCHRSNRFFDRTLFWLKKSKRALSAPELAKDDDVVIQSVAVNTADNHLPAFRLVSYPDNSPRGFRKLFSKSKRSTSSVSGLSEPFQRGGVRATSGPRLGSYVNAEKKFQKINTPFAQWDTGLVADWFALIGLGMYVQQCKRWVQKGEHLMNASSAEVERELGMKNPLHRKKLRLAVQAMNDDESEMSRNASKLDYLWIARWLDDIGLPQYKDAFIDARIDGRMLHYLTVEDLLFLKINSLMHFASIKAGIRVLRDNNFNSSCLKRRSTEENGQSSGSTKWTLDEVSLWSSHRVMEWLRSIDLSEYAPNLRGSGVHGGLILYENAFNSDLFATLLSIPASKTLLRKHITTKFHDLIGEELYKTKCEHEEAPNYVPMTLNAKIKAHKKFSLMRKKKTDFELTEYVCPMSNDNIGLRSRGNSLTKSSQSSDCTSKSDISRTFTPDQELSLSKSEADILDKAE